MNAGQRARLGALGLAVLAAHGGCTVTGTYEPRPSPRISKLSTAGRVFVRDGRRFDVGFTGDAVDLVSGNDLAVRYARRAYHQQVAGVTTYAVGLAAMLTGIGLLVPPHRSEGRIIAGNVLFWTSLVPMVVSTGFLGAAAANRQDAINIYNDALEAPIDPRAFEDQPPPGGR